MKLSNIILFTTMLLLPASQLLDMCDHVKEVGGAKYRLVNDHIFKLALTCDDCDCVYQKNSSGGGYYCLEHGELLTECLDRDQYYLEGEEVVLITGGWNDADDLRSAEIFSPVANERCSLPQLPQNRYYHSQNGGLVCGGSHPDAKSNCVKLSPASGTWTTSHTLREERYHHVSWATASGVYLIGGFKSPRTSEKVKLDGSVEEGFSLKYDTSEACAISDPDNEVVTITGGKESQNTVSVYSEAGWQRDLAALNQGRYHHACGSYIQEGNKFILVTGGFHAYGDLDSTEIFSGNIWKTVAAKLPVPMYDLKVAVINNRVLSFGGYYGAGGFSKLIFEFKYKSKSWTMIGAMKEPKRGHAVSVISFDDYKKWCK